MRVPYSWLREYCDPGLGAEELAERLAMTGTEVERVDDGRPALGRGLRRRPGARAAEQHPDADRLSVCTVDTGDGEPRTIVCGAPNVAAGQTVAVALPGATHAGRRRSCGKAKLRGVESDGMILSETELEIGEDADGILVLDDGPARRAPPLAEVLPLAEPVLELEVTPNRVDCLGVYGVAREVHAITAAPLGAEPWAEDAAADGRGRGRPTTPRSRSRCPSSARASPPASSPTSTIGPSPPWLKARLIAAGQRPINNVVDITNYVMLLTAQPLHAFDLDKVPDGALTVRTAERGREDDDPRRRRARPSTPRRSWSATATAPRASPGSWAARSPRSPTQTTSVLLEVANWNGTNILRTSRLLGLRSEASSRFEKQLHPELCMRAQRIASRLMVELCGAKLVPGTIDVAAEIPPPRASSACAASGSSGLLGMRDRAGRPGRLPRAARLRGRGRRRGPRRSTVPPDRHYDVTREVDLIEEVGARPRPRRAPALDPARGRPARSAA